MSFGSQYNLNQRITYLEYLLNNLPPFPPTSTLAEVLTAGNNATDKSIVGIKSETYFAGIDIKDDSNNYIKSNISNGDITVSSSDRVVLNSTGIQLNASDFITITANNDNMSLQADDDISLTSISKGIVFTAGNGDGGQPDITLTTNTGTLTGNINLYSSGSIFLLSGSSIDLNAQNSYITLSALTDLTIQTTGLGSINTNAPNMNSYGYALPICLNQFEQGTWSYTLGGQVFEDVFSSSPIQIPLPPQFFAESPLSGYTSTRWQLNFDMNCWNFANSGDKGFAIYLSFLDANGNLYEPFLYNQLTPFCKWDNPPTFNGAYSQFKSINFCDYIDFSGLVGSNDSNIRMQMNIAGDNQFIGVEFKFKIGFTRIQRI